jgi:Ser/Thr protein kinase RdoA (MazF antagonist)
MLWHEDGEVDGEQWIAVAFEFVDGRPPRRPWRADQLRLVLDKLTDIAPLLTPAPPALELEPIEEHLVGTADGRLARIASMQPNSEWLATVSSLCAHAAAGAIGGDSVVHMDLREDNVLIDTADNVWFVDWNWPVVGEAWVDLICLVLSAAGDGLDAEALVANHPLSRDVDPHAIDALLAVLWTFWAVEAYEPVPHGSPHLRDHQRWYLEATRAWLTARLGSRGNIGNG